MSCRYLQINFYHGFAKITEFPPQFVNGEQSDEQHDEKTDELDAYRACEGTSREGQPGPPGFRERLISQRTDSGHAPRRAHHEAQKYRIKKNVTIQGEQSNIWKNKCHREIFVIKDPVINERICKTLHEPQRMNMAERADALTDFVSSQTIR